MYASKLSQFCFCGDCMFVISCNDIDHDANELSMCVH